MLKQSEGVTVGFIAGNYVKYAEVVSEGEPVSSNVRIKDGKLN